MVQDTQINANIFKIQISHIYGSQLVQVVFSRLTQCQMCHLEFWKRKTMQSLSCPRREAGVELLSPGVGGQSLSPLWLGLFPMGWRTDLSFFNDFLF